MKIHARQSHGLALGRQRSRLRHYGILSTLLQGRVRENVRPATLFRFIASYICSVAVLELLSVGRRRSLASKPVGTLSVRLTVGPVLSATRHFINGLDQIITQLGDIARISGENPQVRFLLVVPGLHSHALDTSVYRHCMLYTYRRATGEPTGICRIATDLTQQSKDSDV
jgi:hypothetical protein